MATLLEVRNRLHARGVSIVGMRYYFARQDTQHRSISYMDSGGWIEAIIPATGERIEPGIRFSNLQYDITTEFKRIGLRHVVVFRLNDRNHR